jgi:hypothetical protein
MSSPRTRAAVVAALLVAGVYVQLQWDRAPAPALAQQLRLDVAGVADEPTMARSWPPETTVPAPQDAPQDLPQDLPKDLPQAAPPSTSQAAPSSSSQAAPSASSSAPALARAPSNFAFASRCGADAQRSFVEPEPAAYVLALRTNSSEDDLLEDVETVDDLYARPGSLPVGRPILRGSMLGIGDAVHRLWRFLGCAARHNLRVVCHPEAFNSALEHHTGYLGFLFGCHSKHFACGLFKSWSDLDMTLSVTQEVPISQALGMIEAVRAAQERGVELAAWPPFEAALGVLNPLPRVWPALPVRADPRVSSAANATRTHNLARDGKLVFRAVTCEPRSKRERDEILADGTSFIGYQYVLAFLAEGRSTPLWSRPADQLWRIGVTVRRGDVKYGMPANACYAIKRLYRLSGAAVNASNSEVLVFSETVPEDPEFACLRAMPNARLHLRNKTTTMHNAQARLVREMDHLANAHWFVGVWSQLSFVIESALDDDATAIYGDPEQLTSRVRSIVHKFPTPFAHADMRFRAFDPRATTASVRYHEGHALSCCSRHKHEP